ncbi:MAG: DNA polymerase III subunit gamma/tau, partial [Chitinophagales bacterium]|nr:DNA polymerase III subunit gamma/tau [Hyphomicrobiales bacterium]
IAAAEGQTIDDEALTIIARLAEGSVRDGLSLLDQAFALAGGKVSASDVRGMAGIADGVRIYDLLQTILKGDVTAALQTFGALYDAGADPIQLLTDLADAVHAVSRIKAAGPDAANAALSETEKQRANSLAKALSVPVLARVWQMLLKALDETARSPRVLAAAEMAIIRLCYVSDLPPPNEVLKGFFAPPSDGANREQKPSLARGEPVPLAVESDTSLDEVSPDDVAIIEPPPQAPAKLDSFAAVVALSAAKRDIKLRIALEDCVSLVRFRHGHIELKLLDRAPQNLAQELSRKLQDWTGERWMVSLAEAPGERPLGEIRREDDARLREEARRHPSVQAVFRHFPDAEITAVRALPEKEPTTGLGKPSAKAERDRQ